MASSVLPMSRATRPTATLMKAYCPPIERSTFPEINNAAVPSPAMPIDVTDSSVTKRLSTVRNVGYLMPSPITKRDAHHGEPEPVRQLPWALARGSTVTFEAAWPRWRRRGE